MKHEKGLVPSFDGEEIVVEVYTNILSDILGK
jgi:hypothetical protein